MNQTKRPLDRAVTLLLPIAFIGSMFLNGWAFLLDGHRHEWFRLGFVFGVEGIAMLVLLAKCLLLWRERRGLRRPILLAALIPIVYGVIHLWALLLWPDKSLLLKETIVNGGYLVISCCAFVIVAAENRLESFLRTCRLYAVAFAPVILYYCVRFYVSNISNPENLGVVSYMPLAYAMLEFCVFLALDVLLYPARRFAWVNYALYALFSVGIALSQTKGPMVCLLISSCTVLAYTLIKKENRRISAQMMTISVLTLLLFSTVLFPATDRSNRVLAFLNEFSSSSDTQVSLDEIKQTTQIIQSATPEQPNTPEQPSTPEEPDTSEQPDTPEEPTAPDFSDKPVDVSEFYLSGDADKALADGVISQQEYDQILQMVIKLRQTNMGGRSYLWTCAVEEIKSAPLFGQGPMFYQEKYGTYPHNFFLELATDFGLPVTLLVLAAGLFVFLRLFGLSRKDSHIAAFLIYVCSFLFRAMVSGSLYDYRAFFQYGFCILIVLLYGRKKSDAVPAGEG